MCLQTVAAVVEGLPGIIRALPKELNPNLCLILFCFTLCTLFYLHGEVVVDQRVVFWAFALLALPFAPKFVLFVVFLAVFGANPGLIVAKYRPQMERGAAAAANVVNLD
jgi:hypothetical protein